MNAPLPPAAPDSGTRVLRIVGLVLLAGVVLCGVVGTCLFLVTLALPLFGQQ